MIVRCVIQKSPVLAALVAGIVCLSGICLTARGQETINFERDIQPIFAAHCWKCHGEMRAAGGLRLDQKKFAVRGGGSGKNLLSLSREGNELLRRVQSTVPEERMPPKGPPLAEEQIATLDRWIAQGAHWPEKPPPDEQTRRGVSPPGRFEQLLNSWEYVASAPFRPVYFAAIGLLVVMLIVERVKQRRATVATRSSWLTRRIARQSRAWYLVGFLVLVCCWLVQLMRDQAARAEAMKVATSSKGTGATKDPYRGIHDPYRPQHPPRLGGTYYRGNDERSEELFNGGFYRTATFHVHLADEAGHDLAWGDELPARPHIRFEIIRSPHSSPSLFATSIMDHVFLSAVQPEQLAKVDKVEFTPLIAETAGERWSALLPLDAIPPQGRLSGKIYVYKGNEADKEHRQGDPSYLIGYELISEDGKISPQSQIWMASVYNVGSLQWPEPGQIPADHWFDFRPIPEIEK